MAKPQPTIHDRLPPGFALHETRIYNLYEHWAEVYGIWPGETQPQRVRVRLEEHAVPVGPTPHVPSEASASDAPEPAA